MSFAFIRLINPTYQNKNQAQSPISHQLRRVGNTVGSSASSHFCPSIVPSVVQGLNVEQNVELNSCARRYTRKQRQRYFLIHYARWKVSLVASNQETAFLANVTHVVARGDVFVGKERERQRPQYRNWRMKRQVSAFGQLKSGPNVPSTLHAGY